MAITWSLLAESTETAAPFELKTYIRVSSITGGFLCRIDRETTYAGRLLPVSLNTSITACTAASPTTISWSEQFSDTRSSGDVSVIAKTYVGTPLDHLNNAIPGGQIWRHEKTYYYQSKPSVSAEIALTWMPSGS